MHATSSVVAELSSEDLNAVCQSASLCGLTMFLSFVQMMTKAMPVIIGIGSFIGASNGQGRNGSSVGGNLAAEGARHSESRNSGLCDNSVIGGVQMQAVSGVNFSP